MTDKAKTPATIQAEKAIAEYREQIRRIYGSKIARNTVLHYADGWVWYKIAQKYPDGSVGVVPPYDAVRTKMLIQMTENLKKRK